MKFLRHKRITFGQFTAHQFTVFESKAAFSIIFYFFVGAGWQDRFHTHAFRAVSLRIFGSYRERVKHTDGTISERLRDEKRIFHFAKRHEHMLGHSTGCLVLLLAGPWEKTWTETRNGQVRTLAWGRKTVAKG